MNKSINSFVTFVVVELVIWIIVFDQIRKRITIYLEKDKNGEMKSRAQNKHLLWLPVLSVTGT